MHRKFSSSNSVNLIQLDTELEVNCLVKSNSLVEMFDPIFDKQLKNSSIENSYKIDNSSSSEDIFAPSTKNPNLNNRFKADFSDDDIFEEVKKTNSQPIESLYPSLNSFKSSYSNERKYSVFDKSDPNTESNISYDLRPSLFNVLSINQNSTNLFNDGYANKDMERFMKNVTELHMQSLNMLIDEKSHLVFDLSSSTKFSSTINQGSTIRIAIGISVSVTTTTIEPFCADIDIFTTSERDLVTRLLSLLSITIENSMLFLRIYGRGEYLKQGEFPLIQNQSVFQSYRSQTEMKLVLERIDFTESIYVLNETISADASCSVYQLLDEHFYNVNRDDIENGFIKLNSHRNNVASLLREYRSQVMDISSIEASIQVIIDICKSLCLICNNICTGDIAQHVVDLEDLVSTMKMAYSTKNDETLSKSVEGLIKGLDHTTRLIIQMINEVTVFCNCNFSVRMERLCLAGLLKSQSGSQSITTCRSHLFVKLGVICSLKDVANFNCFFIKLTVKVGRQNLSNFLISKPNNLVDKKISRESVPTKIHSKFPQCIPFNDILTFENLSMFLMPPETTLLINIYGRRFLSSPGFYSKPKESRILTEELIGWAEVPLFDSARMLRQGKLLIGIWPNSQKPKVPHAFNRLKSSAVLEIELPDFHVPVKHINNPNPNTGEIPFLKQTKTDLKMIDDAVNLMWLNNNTDSAEHSCQILWKHRGILMENPRYYIALCLAMVYAWPDDIKYENKDFLLNYIERCHKNTQHVTITKMLHLIGSQMPLIKIRQWAVQTLKETGPDACISLIPWLVEGLKYDCNLNSSGLDNLLLYFSLMNINFATSLFWQLSAVSPDDIHGYTAMLLLGMLRYLVNNVILEMWTLQMTFVENLQNAATLVKTTKNPSERKYVLHTNLEELYDLILNQQTNDGESIKHPLCSYRLPYHNGLVLTKMEMKDCSYFNSVTLPLRIVFKGFDDSLREVMFKSGDDLRQDILILELFKLMDDIWINEGLDLRMVHYRVISTGRRSGLVELVEDCTTLRKIQESKGIAAPLTSVSGISDWLKCQNTSKVTYLKSVNNFLLTCAACCVSTYLLGIGDRHNDNIMIQTSGCIFHIDFAKILGDAQTFAGIKRDRVPFVLTQDMVHVLEDYQPMNDDKRTGMQLLIDKCCEAYNILRRHWCSILSILAMAAEANIPGVTTRTIQYVVKMMELNFSDIQASEQFTDLIRKSVSSISTPMNFVIHNLAQMKYFSNNEGSLFSFTPKIHRNGPRILEVSIKAVKKIRSRNKYYTYQIWVHKENIKKHEIVFRRYEHFIELGQQLALLFPLSIVQKFYQNILQAGPPSGVVAAEARKATLQHFVSQIMVLEDEISQCDLMQTFFHSTLYDEQLAENESFTYLLTSSLKTEYPEIQLKISTYNNDSKIEIFVKHARNVTSSRLSEPPNAYVKTYILPGYISKRKTNVIMKNSSPSFNDIITYHNIDIKPGMKLEISVWHYEALGENFCIGSVAVPISRNMPSKEKWYRLSDPTRESCGSDRLSLSKSWDMVSSTESVSSSFTSNVYPKLA